MSAIHRAVTGLYAKRRTYQSCQRDSKGQQRKLGKAIKRRYPLQRPKLSLPSTRLKQYAVL